jgi:hypothetical protein
MMMLSMEANRPKFLSRATGDPGRNGASGRRCRCSTRAGAQCKKISVPGLVLGAAFRAAIKIVLVLFRKVG